MGRKAEFDRNQVIEAAMEVFWRKGYHASSMNDLKEAMGLQPGSIYAAFGGKHDLLLACMEHYSSNAKATFEEIGATSSSQKEAFRRIYDLMIEQMKSEDACRSCLIINTLLELAAHDYAGGRAAREYLGRNQQIFEKMLQQAIDSGELETARSHKDLAAFLMGIVFSLRVMGKADAERSTLESIRDQALEHVFG